MSSLSNIHLMTCSLSNIFVEGLVLFFFSFLLSVSCQGFSIGIFIALSTLCWLYASEEIQA
jgi:hypothetical protein